MSIVNQNNFDGIDIDYEGKYLSDHFLFSQFLSELSSALHQNGKILICTVEAKDSEYQNIDASCDQVRVMAYDKYFYDFGSGHFSTTTPLSISVTNAPLSFDKSVVADAEKYIPANKIILGIPTYGYDFSYSIKSGIRNVNWYAAYSYTDAVAKAKILGCYDSHDTTRRKIFRLHDAWRKSFRRLFRRSKLSPTGSRSRSLSISAASPFSKSTVKKTRIFGIRFRRLIIMERIGLFC